MFQSVKPSIVLLSDETMLHFTISLVSAHLAWHTQTLVVVRSSHCCSTGGAQLCTVLENSSLTTPAFQTVCLHLFGHVAAAAAVSTFKTAASQLVCHGKTQLCSAARTKTLPPTSIAPEALGLVYHPIRSGTGLRCGYRWRAFPRARKRASGRNLGIRQTEAECTVPQHCTPTPSTCTVLRDVPIYPCEPGVCYFTPLQLPRHFTAILLARDQTLPEAET